MKKLNIDNVIELLKVNYEKSEGYKYVKKPLAHALYNTWKQINAVERARVVDSFNVIDNRNDEVVKVGTWDEVEDYDDCPGSYTIISDLTGEKVTYG